MRPTTPKTRAEFVLGTCGVIAKHIISSNQGEQTDLPVEEVEKTASRLGIGNTTVIAWDFDVANAFVLGTPNTCYVVVSTALIETLSEDELVAVITHEMAHAAQQHTIKLTTELVFYLFVGYLTQRNANCVGSRLASLGVLLGSALLLLRDVRRAEKEADSLAISVLENPDALETAVQKVNTAGRKTKRERSEIDEIIATHPSLEARFEDKRS